MVQNSSIRILLQSLSGAEVEIAIASDATVQDLKVEVSNLWSMPVAFQMLTSEACLLTDNSECLSMCGLIDNSLSVVAVLSMQSIQAAIACLEGVHTVEVQLEALQNLTQLGPKYLDDVITAVGKLLNAESSEVKLAAWTSITKIAERGNETAIDVVTAQIEYESTRQAAVEALGQIAEIGNPCALYGLGRFLENEDLDVCMFALDAYAQFAGKGHIGAIEVVSECLCHEEDAMRWRAVEVLQQIIVKGDQHGIYYAKALQNHSVRAVRWAATEALGQFNDP